MTSPIVAESPSSSTWGSSDRLTSRARVSVPASGDCVPAINASSVDLPSPLAPTIPIRSPALIPSVTSRSSERLA